MSIILRRQYATKLATVLIFGIFCPQGVSWGTDNSLRVPRDDLDSSPTKLIEVVRIGKQLLMTRGSLTTFSVANDVAKYFAIIPALFSPIYPGLGALNILGLASPLSAVLSAIIYNALVIVALIPAALKGVKYREVPSGQLLTHNLLVWGLGGIVAPFVFIKLIDMLLAFCGIM